MTLTAVAKRYADALADVVTRSGSPLRPQDAVTELGAFAAALESSAELREALSTPAVAVGRKRAVVGRVAGLLKLSLITRNFLFVLTDHGRLIHLAGIVHAFELTLDERLGFARAEVAAAGELSEAQRAALTAELERLTGKRIRMRYSIDPSLIGGAVARIGSTVYDGSLRRQLEMLERRLGEEG